MTDNYCCYVCLSLYPVDLRLNKTSLDTHGTDFNKLSGD